MAATVKDITAIIVGINSREYVRKCLASLRSADWGAYTHSVIYVDNASSDRSLEMVRAEFPEVMVIANQQNVGFCAACNQGAAAVESRYVYLLNNDTILFPESVRLLAEFLECTPRAGAAGNRLLNPDLTDQWSARRFPTWINAIFGRRTVFGRLFPRSHAVRDYLYKDQFAQGRPFAVDWIPGSCTLVRSEAYSQSGGLPEDMHYWSDAVFCDRLRKLGWDIYVIPDAKLVHYEGQGTGGKTATVRRWLIFDFHRGAYRFYCEHFALGRYSPVRWFAGAVLETRARVLILIDIIRHLARGAQSERA
jgi:N-acetylglucosaminyl-diphospho-decaprenol L-rhamnosyltransferase